MARLSSSNSLPLPTPPNTLSTISPVTTSSITQPTGDAPPTPSSSSTSSVHTATPTRRSRFWPNLSLPRQFSSRKNRYYTDFHVRSDEPHRKYLAGDHVLGTVALVVLKPTRITHLVVTLHGYVQVVRDAGSGGKLHKSGLDLLPRGGSAGPQYHGDGHASLFQDEQVLTGDGKLEPGKYEFAFDLVFPDVALPSSIEFERGKVSYNITAALTRPNALEPVDVRDRPVLLVQQCDVGGIRPPRPQTIWLEPTSKTPRSRRKRSLAVEKAAATPTDTSVQGSEPDLLASIETPGREQRTPQPEPRAADQSDVRSEISGESGRTTSTGLSRTELSQLTNVSTSVTSAAKQKEVNDKTISATVDVPKGGYVAGDTIPVRISIRHNKHMKSMSGIIVTLFRQGSIDVSPNEKAFNEPLKSDDTRLMESHKILPRSRTGLGGLSLSSSGSTMLFRKDLDQNTVPLIIDPITLQSNMTVSVKLPDDAFPSIVGVPGNMIKFTYQIEVIMDLGGRMANHYHGPHSSRIGPLGSGASDATNATYGPRRGASIADTAQIRRMEGVFPCGLTIVVGTTDSAKTRKRNKSLGKAVAVAANGDEADEDLQQSSHVSDLPTDSYFPPPPNGYDYGPPTAIPYHITGQQDSTGPPRPSYHEINGHATESTPVYIPPPQVPDNQNMTEKDRIRQAEATLLPSQPSAPAGESSGAAEDDLYDAEDTPRRRGSFVDPAGPSAPRSISPSAPAGPSSTDITYSQRDDEGPSAPTADELSHPGVSSTVDKQEVERQRLMGEASAPPVFPDDMDRQPDAPSSSIVDVPRGADEAEEPSAPMLNEDDEYEGLYGVRSHGAGSSAQARPVVRHDGEQLPAYER